MGVYITTKCGHCNNNLQFFQYGGNTVCGAPNVKCHHCHGINSTKMDLYRNFALKDKISFFITEIIFEIGLYGVPLGIGVYSFFLFFIKLNFFDFSISKDPWYWIIIYKLFMAFISLGPLYIGLNSIYNNLTIYKQIKKMEKVYDEQGGFLWSNQQY